MSSSTEFTLFPHQQRVVDHMKTHRGLIAIHQTGSGKTICALGVIAELKMSTVIVTPLSIQKQFQQQLDNYNIIQKYQLDIQLITPQLFANKMAKGEIDCHNKLLIVDEAHNLRTKVRYSTSADSTVKGSRAYAVVKAAQAAAKVLLLTATPVINTPFDIYNLIMMVEGIPPEQAIDQENFSKAISENTSAFIDMFSCKTSFHFEQDPVAAGYPERIDEATVYLNMTDEYYKQYKAIENKSLDSPSSVTAICSAFESKATHAHDQYYSLLRQAINAIDGTQSPKINWVFNFLSLASSYNNKQKTLVFSSWMNAGMNLIKKVLDDAGIEYVCVDGDTSAEDRDLAMQKYNSDAVNIMLISTKAGGEGLNLKGTSHVIILESNWNKATDDQIIGRAIRKDSHSHLEPQDRKVYVWRLMMRKPLDCLDAFASIDEELYKLAYNKKLPVIDQFLSRVQALSIENKSCNCAGKLEFCNSWFQDCPFRKPEKPSKKRTSIPAEDQPGQEPKKFFSFAQSILRGYDSEPINYFGIVPKTPKASRKPKKIEC
jgi:superfamily II DNA or RNA helicase